MSLTKQEETILESIIVPSESDPDKPEFPPGDPKFPATPTYKINIPGFSDVWLKDESINPTGTHKDRTKLIYPEKFCIKMIFWK